MQLFIDESGNTGQPMIKAGGKSNFTDQPFFVLAGLLANPDQIVALEFIVDELKAKYHVQGDELKSKGIYEKRPELYKDLFETIYQLDIPIFIELTDKKYYLCMQITNTFLFPPHSLPINDKGFRLRQLTAEVIYSILTNELFASFCELCLAPDAAKFELMFDQLEEFFAEMPGDPLIEKLHQSLLRSKKDYKEFLADVGNPDAYNRFLPLPDTDKKNRVTTILPNTNSFANLVGRAERLRTDSGLTGITIIHDEQAHFDEIMKANLEIMKNTDADKLLEGTKVGEKSLYKIHDSSTVSFEDSKAYKPIQVADLLAGFMSRAWDDYFNGRFESLDRYTGILRTLFFRGVGGLNDHQSAGPNMVVPETHYNMFMQRLKQIK